MRGGNHKLHIIILLLRKKTQGSNLCRCTATHKKYHNNTWNVQRQTFAGRRRLPSANANKLRLKILKCWTRQTIEFTLQRLPAQRTKYMLDYAHTQRCIEAMHIAYVVRFNLDSFLHCTVVCNAKFLEINLQVRIG